MITIPLPRQLASYGGLSEFNASGGTVIAVATAETYYQWVSTTVGVEKGAGYVVGSAANDNMVIGTLGAGKYNIEFDCVYDGESGANISIAVFVDGTRVDRLTKKAELGAGILYKAASVDVKRGTISTGDVTSTYIHDGDPAADTGYLHISEVAEDTGTLTEFTFTGVDEPAIVHFHGRYNGNPAHENEAQIFDTSITVSVVSNGGSDYTCIRDHNSSDADTEPGTGAEWESYWELVGSGGGAWDNSSDYVSGFIDIRATTKDIPSTGVTEDITREWALPGTHAKLADYSDNGTVRVRFIHNTAGNNTHNIYFDQILLQTGNANRSVSGHSIVDLAATETVDLRVTSSTNGDEIIIKSANLNINRVDI